MNTHINSDGSSYTTGQTRSGKRDSLSPGVSAEVKAFRAVGSSNPGVEPMMAPPISARMSKPAHRKAIKRFFKKQAEKAQTNLQDAMKETS